MDAATRAADGSGETSPALLFDRDGLLARLATLTDSRQRRGIRSSLPLLWVLAVLARLGGQDQPSGLADGIRARGDFLRSALPLRRPTLPHANTDRRIFAQVVVPGELDQTVSAFRQELPQVGQGVLRAIDAKTISGTLGTAHPRGAPLWVASLPREGSVLRQVAAGETTKDIGVAPPLLRALDRRGKVVIGAALPTQRALSAPIVEQGGHSPWFAEGNPPPWRGTASWPLPRPSPRRRAAPGPPDWGVERTVTKGHGRSAVRPLTVRSDLTDCRDWPGLAPVSRLGRRRPALQDGETTPEVVSGLSSFSRAPRGPHARATLMRTCGGVANGLPYRRDVTFYEDATRHTSGNAGRVMAILNHLVISRLRHQGQTNLAPARRECDANLSLGSKLVTLSPRRL